MILFTFLFSLIFAFNSFADVATPSELEYESDVYIVDSDIDDKYETFMEDLQDEEYEVDLGELPLNNSSDMQNFSEFVTDIFVSVANKVVGNDKNTDEDDSPTSIDTAEESPRFMLMNSFDPASPDRYGFHKNVVVFHGSFNNYDCDLVIPYSAYASLDIIDDHLVNIGSSSVTGKLLYDGESLDPSQYDSYTYILNPVYGSTTNVYNYGSFNYRRHYYLNNSSSYNRISYEDMYGNFTVTDTDVFYTSSERLYYLGLVLIFLLGGAFICRKH